MSNPAKDETAVQIALAEYAALRTELMGVQTAQYGIAVLALSISGAVIGFAIDHERAVLVLVLGPVGPILGFLHLHYVRVSRLINRYIGERLRPALLSAAALPEDGAVFDWETRSRAFRDPGAHWLQAVPLLFLFAIIPVASSVASIFFEPVAVSDVLLWGLRGLGALLAVAYLWFWRDVPSGRHIWSPGE